MTHFGPDSVYPLGLPPDKVPSHDNLLANKRAEDERRKREEIKTAIAASQAERRRLQEQQGTNNSGFVKDDPQNPLETGNLVTGDYTNNHPEVGVTEAPPVISPDERAADRLLSEGDGAF